MIVIGKGGEGSGDRDIAESQNSTCRRFNTRNKEEWPWRRRRKRPRRRRSKWPARGLVLGQRRHLRISRSALNGASRNGWTKVRPFPFWRR